MSGMKIIFGLLAAVGILFAAASISQAADGNAPATMPAISKDNRKSPPLVLPDVEAAKMAINDARKALAANEIKAVQAALDRAMAALEKIQKAITPASESKSPFVNAYCPIMGGKIDPGKPPDSLTREYKGMKVAFCCPMCPPQWDKLSDAEKDAKLKAAMEKK